MRAAATRNDSRRPEMQTWYYFFMAELFNGERRFV